MAGSLSPGFLVAAPTLLDPNFQRSVVLLVEHRAEGSLGFVVNRDAQADFKGLVEEIGIVEEGQAVAGAPVMLGGPVAQETGWVVYDPSTLESQPSGAVLVSDRIGVSASRELLKAIALGEGPSRRLLVLGYAGWSAGQLDEELKQGAWFALDMDDRIIFETPVAERWDAALRASGIDPAKIAGATVGGEA